MSKIHTQLIEKYKTLESLIREHYGQSVYEYEQTLEESEQKKMQLIRLQRNYIQHENDFDTFVAVSEKQLQFLDTLIKRIELEDGCAKDAMISVAKFGCCTTQDTINTAAKLLCTKKNGQVLIIDSISNVAIGFLDYEKVVQIIAAGGKLSDKLIKHTKAFDKDFLLTSKDTQLKELEQMDCNKFVVCLQTKKAVGVILYD